MSKLSATHHSIRSDGPGDSPGVPRELWAEYRHGRIPGTRSARPRTTATCATRPWAAELTANVPSRPGWTVADLVRHVAQVYLHKGAPMRTGEEPEEVAAAFAGRLRRRWPRSAGLTARCAPSSAPAGPGLPALTWYDPY